jgi:hypothetical protein
MLEALRTLFPEWLAQAFSLSLALSHWQQLGLAFLLGSFAVATWSDLKHLSAQREFLEIWLVFLIGMIVVDVAEVTVRGWPPWQVPAIKWGLILLLSLFSFEDIDLGFRLFRLAPADVAALAAAASLLKPVLLLLFYFGARLLARFLGPFLARGRKYYPFMPIVSLATLGVLLLGLVMQTQEPVPARDAATRTASVSACSVQSFRATP